jgi:hypothetical protein
VHPHRVFPYIATESAPMSPAIRRPGSARDLIPNFRYTHARLTSMVLVLTYRAQPATS